jgi:mono/diheme cytochrome c family protein
MFRYLAVPCLLILVACAGPPAPEASGEEIYQQVCANCHGSDLNGGVGPAVGAGSNSAAQDDDFLVLTITRGRGPMPSFDSTLSDEQISRVVDYLRTEHESSGSG